MNPRDKYHNVDKQHEHYEQTLEMVQSTTQNTKLQWKHRRSEPINFPSL